MERQRLVAGELSNPSLMARSTTRIAILGVNLYLNVIISFTYYTLTFLSDSDWFGSKWKVFLDFLAGMIILHALALNLSVVGYHELGPTQNWDITSE